MGLHREMEQSVGVNAKMDWREVWELNEIDQQVAKIQKKKQKINKSIILAGFW